MIGGRGARRPRRLVLLGSILVDVVLYVPRLPPRGGDVLAGDSLTVTGGGFNVLAAAARQGLPGAYAGRHGTGRFGDQVRADLAAEGVELLLPPTPGGDTGFCVGLVETGGERTYVTREGVDGALTAAELAALPITEDDVAYLSGYDLTYAHAGPVAARFAALDPGVLTVFDPGPLVAELEAELLEPVLRRADWISANAREAELLTGRADPSLAAGRLVASGFGRRGAVVRTGPGGCRLASSPIGPDGSLPVPVPGGPVVPVDTAGAGDTHVGAFVAALGRGLAPAQACRWANAAAAASVTRKGPATAPTLAATRRDLDLP
jgi:sugar/nucleoside kinase (ribokinase family)